MPLNEKEKQEYNNAIKKYNRSVLKDYFNEHIKYIDKKYNLLNLLANYPLVIECFNWNVLTYNVLIKHKIFNIYNLLIEYNEETITHKLPEFSKIEIMEFMDVLFEEYELALENLKKEQEEFKKQQEKLKNKQLTISD